MVAVVAEGGGRGGVDNVGVVGGHGAVVTPGRGGAGTTNGTATTTSDVTSGCGAGMARLWGGTAIAINTAGGCMRGTDGTCTINVVGVVGVPPQLTVPVAATAAV